MSDQSMVTIPLKEYDNLRDIKKAFESGEGYFMSDYYGTVFYGTEKSIFVKCLIDAIGGKLGELKSCRERLSDLEKSNKR